MASVSLDIRVPRNARSYMLCLAHGLTVSTRLGVQLVFIDWRASWIARSMRLRVKPLYASERGERSVVTTGAVLQ